MKSLISNMKVLKKQTRYTNTSIKQCFSNFQASSKPTTRCNTPIDPKTKKPKNQVKDIATSIKQAFTIFQAFTKPTTRG